VQVTAWDHADESGPLTLPIAPPSLAPTPRIAPPTHPGTLANLRGLGASPLGAVPARAATLAPAPKAFAPPSVAPQTEAPTTLRRSLDTAPREPIGEHTSLDVFASIGALPEEPTGEDEAPFEDPSPTPPDGMPSIADDDEGVTDYRPSPEHHSLPPAAPAPAPRNRLRARTIGVDEAEARAPVAPPATPAASPLAVVTEPEGTRMIQIGWEAPPDAPPPPSAPTPLRTPPVPDPFAAPVAPMVERTMAIDLSTSGMAPSPAPPWSSPGLTPHGWTPPPSMPSTPYAPTPAPPPASPHPVGWIIAGVVGVFVLLTLFVVLARA
jgi:hypothetical protein